METFGGLGDGLVELLREGAAGCGDRLTATEYDETTWSARSFLAFVMQRISVATQRAVAAEIEAAMGLGQWHGGAAAAGGYRLLSS